MSETNLATVCKCDAAGYCPIYRRPMPEHLHAICHGDRLTPAQQAVYRAHWREQAGLPIVTDHCPHRGEQLRVETCHTCGNRGKQVPVYVCHLHGSCSVDQHHVGQKEKICRHCPDYQGPLLSKWDRQVTKLIPEPDGQNFNCSLIEFRGRRLFAYRHKWGGARIALAELDHDWQVKWNCLLKFPHHPHNVYQEDPRLFIFRGELHIAFTAVQTGPTVAHVGYARLEEVAPSTWHVTKWHIPDYPGRQKWEKNWGFFEAEGQLWAVYDAERHVVLKIDGQRAERVFAHDRRTIPGTEPLGDIRGGASPQFWRGEFYSFVHFKQRGRKNYAGGLYTFDVAPPFAPVRYLPYPLLTPTREHCTHDCAKNVVYPCGAALLDWRWTISYGAYDRDSRLVAFDVNEVESALMGHHPQHSR